MLDNWLQLGTSLAYEKEVLPVGKIVRWVNDKLEAQHATIGRKFLDNIVSNFKKFKEVGVRVPIFKTHSEDPSNTRGTVEDAFIKPNSRGVDSLFIKASFTDEDAVKLAMDNDVSVLVPPKFVDGRGNKYEWPLRHVAITATPVVPGLDNWSGPMVFAFDNTGVLIKDDGKGGIDVDAYLNSLASELELSFEDGASQADKFQKVLDGVKALKAEKIELSLAHEEQTVELPFPPVMLKQLKDSRKAIIASHTGTVLSSAMAKKFEERFCSDQALQLDLSLTTEETQFDRELELAREIAKDRPLVGTGRKVIKLSHGADGEDNGLISRMKKKAEAHEKRQAKLAGR